jgi:hypothetical protein
MHYILKLRSSQVFMTYANVIRVYVNMSMSYEYFLSVLSPCIQDVFFSSFVRLVIGCSRISHKSAMMVECVSLIRQRPGLFRHNSGSFSSLKI